MYKNIEVLDKTKHKGIKFDTVSDIEVAKNIGVVPLGVDEVLDMCSISPVVISAGQNGEFVAFTGISSDINIYKNETLYVPKFIKAYPFLNILIKDESDTLNTVVAIDNNPQYIGKDKTNKILTKDKQLEDLASKKIELVRNLNRFREISRKIVQELKEKNLLLRKDFRVNTNQEEKVILDEFYVINREEFLKLDDATLALWAKKGWISVIDAHIKSLINFEKIFK